MAELRAVLPLPNRGLHRVQCEVPLGTLQLLSLRRQQQRRGLEVRAVAAPVAQVRDLRKQILEEEVERKNFRIREVDTTEPVEWHAGTVLRVAEVVPGVRAVTLETECSRELVKRANAYLKPGQLAQVRIGEEVVTVASSSPPFPKENNEPVLYKVRGDIPAGTTKVPQYSLSVLAPLDLHVQETTARALYNVKEGDEVQVGPFLPTGLDLRPVMFINRFSTLLIFAQGDGIAVARAMVETQDGNVGTLNLSMRQQTRLFYSAPQPSLIAYREKFDEWEARKVDIRTTVDTDAGEAWDGFVGSLSTLWDEDDIEYDPETTAALVCAEKDQRESIKSLLTDAGIPDQQVVFWEA